MSRVKGVGTWIEPQGLDTKSLLSDNRRNPTPVESDLGHGNHFIDTDGGGENGLDHTYFERFRELFFGIRPRIIWD